MQYYNKKTVGQRIKEARREQNMTQCILATKLDYTNERQLQRIESGETACSVDKLMEIAQILKISTDFLLFGVNKENGSTFQQFFDGKSEGQKLYLKMILQVAADNLKLME